MALFSRSDQIKYLLSETKKVDEKVTYEFQRRGGLVENGIRAPNAKQFNPIGPRIKNHDLFEEVQPNHSRHSRVATGRHLQNPKRVNVNHMFTMRQNFLAPDVMSHAANLENSPDYGSSIDDVETDGHTKILTDDINVEVPDHRDVEWLTENDRLKAAGDTTSLPLGREQRTVRKTTKLIDEIKKTVRNASDASHKLAAVKTAIENGIASTKIGQDAVIAELGKIMLGSKGKLDKKTEEKTVAKIAKSLKFGKWEDEFSHRFWSKQQLDEETPMKNKILLFMLQNNKKDDVDVKVFKWRRITAELVDNKQTIGIEDAFRAMDGKTPVSERKGQVSERDVRYIDLKLNGIVPLRYALEQTRRGTDGRRLNGYDVPDKRSHVGDIIPVGILNFEWATKFKINTEDFQKKGVDINRLKEGLLVPVPQFQPKKAPVEPSPFDPDPEDESEAAAAFAAGMASIF